MASRVSLSPAKERQNPQWPPSSSCSLPSLNPWLVQRLDSGHVEFPINEECTSLALVPSGRHIVAGFTDGTLRLFDLTGCFRSQDDISSNQSKFSTGTDNDDAGLFDSDSSDDDKNPFDSDDDEDDATFTKSRFPTSGFTARPSYSTSGGGVLVCSKSHQRYGAVVCQIHAKGVHTSLQMTVDVSPDGLYAFGGVARGSMELVAVDLSDVERHVDAATMISTDNERMDVLDLAHVHRHADAKLRGFGACTRLHRRGTWSEARDSEPTYILLTGKGIKNIHIWSFQPRRKLWQCLYDTQSNGNSISILHLRYSPTGVLHAISKSDLSQKLRVWDLSHEQDAQIDLAGNDNNRERPKRPPYTDLSGTESTLGIGGDFGFGGCLYEQISLVNLNVESPYNVSELLLPGRSGAASRPRGARQQRGEMQALQQVAGMSMDGSHVLLEMSDFSVVHFYFEGSAPRLETLLDGGSEGDSRTLCVARVGSSGITVAAMAVGGRIKLIQIGDESSEGYWGFHGVAASIPAMSSPCTDSEAIALAAGSSVNLFARRNTSYCRSSYSSSIASEEDSITSHETPITTRSTTTAALGAIHTPFDSTKSATTIVPPSASTTTFFSTVPSSAIKAISSSSAKLTSLHRTPEGVAISPECASQESTQKKKKKSTVFRNATREAPPERKKLVLHLRIPKECEVGVARSHSEPFVDPIELLSINRSETSATISRKRSIPQKELEVPLTVPTKTATRNHELTSNQVEKQLKLHPSVSVVNNSVISIARSCSKKSKRPREVPVLQTKSSQIVDVLANSASAKNISKGSSTDNVLKPTSITNPKLKSKPYGDAPAQSTPPRVEPKKHNSETVAAAALVSLQSPCCDVLVGVESSRQGYGEQNSEKRLKGAESRMKAEVAKPQKADSSEKSQGKTDALVSTDSRVDRIATGTSKSPRTVAPKKIVASVAFKRPAATNLSPSPKKCRRVVDANLGDLNFVNASLPVCWQSRPSTLQRFVSVESAPEEEVRRIKLALEHRASHEMLRNNVLEAVPQLLRCMWSQDGNPTANDVKNALEDVINDYSESLNDLLFRQEMEASALAATLFLPFTPVVSFPFPEVFDQARKTLALSIEKLQCSGAM